MATVPPSPDRPLLQSPSRSSRTQRLSSFETNSPNSPRTRSFLSRGDPVDEKDVSLLVKEVMNLRARVAHLEERRASMANDDDDDYESSSSRVLNTDLISNAKSAGLHTRAIDILKSSGADTFVPDGLRSPMPKPSKFFGAKFLPPPQFAEHSLLPPAQQPYQPELEARSSPQLANDHKRPASKVLTSMLLEPTSMATPSPRSDSTNGGDSPQSLRSKSAGGSSPSSFGYRHVRMSRDLPPEEDGTPRLKGTQVLLKRGGVVVPTEIGFVQFGIPPETIKDSLLVGMSVPRIFVVPSERFDTARGLNMAEVEFPGYFQFFILKHHLTLVVENQEAEDSLRALLTETLLGPPSEHLFAPDEMTEGEACPDHQRELAYFVRPRENRSVNVDSMYKFVQFQDMMQAMMSTLDVGGGDASTSVTPATGGVTVAKLAVGVEIHDCGQHWLVFEKGRLVAEVLKAHMRSQPVPRPAPVSVFTPPVFGVTVLGSSHGFDPHQSTSGFVLWIHGKGIMVDPPPDASDLLRAEGISPRVVTAIVLTHCHADHDAGTFQKILLEGRITLYTTKTIMASFMRKYARISTFTEMFLCRLMEPRLVRPGEAVPFNGGLLKFFYSLHALPCVGFTAQVGDKTFAYSADTFYDPIMLPQLRDEGILSPQRCQALMDFPFESFDICLHEAGIPPIHTSVKTLQGLSAEARRRLRIIHIDDSAARASGLVLARAGTQNTIVILPASDETNLLNVLMQSELFFPSRIRSSMRFSTLAPSSLGAPPNSSDFDWLDQLQPSFGSVLSRESFPRLLTVKTQPSPMSSPKHSERSQPFYTGQPPVSGPHVHQPRRSSQLEGFESQLASSELTLSQVSTILNLAKKVQKKRGELVSAAVGARDEFFFIVAKGFCELRDTQASEEDFEPPEGPDNMTLEVGDAFGRFSVSECLPRRCQIVAQTDALVLAFDMQALCYLHLVHPTLAQRMNHIRKARASETWRILDLNTSLSRLVASQRSQLQSVATEILVEAGTKLWECGKPVQCLYIVASGEVVFLDENDGELSPDVLKVGAVCCNVPSMIRQRSTLQRSEREADGINSTVSLMARTSARLFKVRNTDALAFLERNPGLMVQLYPNLFVE